MPLVPKPLFQSCYPGLSIEEHQIHQNQCFILNLHYFQMVFFYKTGDLSENSPDKGMVSLQSGGLNIYFGIIGSTEVYRVHSLVIY